jgi:succinate dehydrogenase / fumarate reductase cytochrome b subunit
MLHGAGVWIARIVLLVAFVLHVSATLQLVKANRAARGTGYAKKNTVQASWSSRIMAVSGLTILTFVIFHILHFTARVGNDYDSLTETLADGSVRHDVYSMVITGFQFLPTSIFYIIAMALLCSHLGHGVSSVFQTLGLATDKNWPLIRTAGHAYAVIIFLGFVSIPIAVLTGALQLPGA